MLCVVPSMHALFIDDFSWPGCCHTVLLLQDITVLNIFNGGMIAEQVAGQYSSEALFGTRNMAVLQRVPVAG